MRSAIEDVRAFIDACGIPGPFQPGIPTGQLQALMRSLLEEEHGELQGAIEAGNLVKIADGCADLIWVAIKTALVYGIPLDRVWHEVRRSNLAKIDAATGRVRKREDGKIMKPEGWIEPDIARMLQPLRHPA